MKIHVILKVFLGLIILSSTAYADSNKKPVLKQNSPSNKDGREIKAKNKGDEQKNSYLKLSYSPPFLGAPSTSRLVGMALRGGTNDLLLSVLAPEHTGLSLKAQPDIYWYTSKPVSKPFQFVEFVLNADTKIEPVFKTHLKPVSKGGIQKLSLSDFNIKLKPGIEYTWVICLVPDPTSRAHDFVTSGKIKYLKPKKELLDKVTISSTKLDPYVFAEAGYWYDTLAATILQVETQGNDKIAEENLVSLLEQVGLNQIAKNTKAEGIK